MNKEQIEYILRDNLTEARECFAELDDGLLLTLLQARAKSKPSPSEERFNRVSVEMKILSARIDELRSVLAKHIDDSITPPKNLHG